jgi:hypothetical protein
MSSVEKSVEQAVEAVAEAMPVMPVMAVESVPVIETTPKLHIHMPEDPQDQFLCEGCQ